MSKTTNKFAPEVRDRAIRMVLGHEAGLFNALYNPPYDRLIEGSRAAFHRALAMFATPFARAMLRA